MSKTIVLLGEPKSNQKIYKITCRGRFASMYMSSEGKAIKDGYTLQARSQWQNKPIEGSIEVNISLFFGTLRKADIDNFGKLLLDSLTGVCWIDDSQIVKMTICKLYDKKKPRIEIAVSKLSTV